MTRYSSAGRTFGLVNDDAKKIYGMQVWNTLNGQQLVRLPKAAMRNIDLALQAAYKEGRYDVQRELRENLGIKQF